MALKELGQDAEAESYMDGANYYRELRGLKRLRFRIEDERLLSTRDPEIIVGRPLGEGPEL